MLKSIILAAGEGSRMKSDIPKCAHKVCGKSLVEYILDESKKANIQKNIVVVGYKGEIIENLVKKDTSTIIANQPVEKSDPYGTAFAVKQGVDHIEDEDCVLILCGDTPLITSETMRGLMNFHSNEKNDVTVLTSNFDNPFGYGRIIRDNKNAVIGIVEQKDGTEEQLKIEEVNSGIYCFNGKTLKFVLDRIDNKNSQGEYYITDGIHIVNENNGKVGGYLAEDSREIQGINSKIQLAEASEIMKMRINENLMLEGAIIIDPKNTYIESNVKIGRDSVIYPGVILEGNTVIGKNTTVGMTSRIVDSIIGDNVEIENSVIKESVVKDRSKIGPFAYLRPNSKIEEDVKIGDFVEVKNSIVKKGAKASHLTYIGDSEVGENVNLGCGVVFVNYDGANKNKIVIEDGAFIGCNANLVAPVKIGENAYVAAGSTITKDVSKDSLAIARERQIQKDDWVKKNVKKK